MNIKLLCRIADIDNAIRISGDGNGLRLTIDIDDASVNAVVSQLVDMREKSLILELKTEDHDDFESRSKDPSRSTSADESDEQLIADYRRSFV